MSLFGIAYDETGEATRIVRAGMFVIIVCIGGAALWSVIAPISGAVVASGIIKVDTKRKTVQHISGGTVKEILVREGQYVEAKQPLVILNDAQALSELNILKDQLNVQLAREARLLAEKNFANSVEFPPELARSEDGKVREILAAEKALFHAKKKSIDEEIVIIRHEIEDARLEATSIQSQIELSGESIRYTEERVAAGEVLNSRQFIERDQFLQLKESLADKRQALNALKASFSATRQRQAELDLRIITLRNEFTKAADDALKDTRGTIFELQQKIRPAELALNGHRILAPIAGQVIDLKVTTIGGVVQAGQALMDIVPKEQELLMEVKVKTTDIDQVHVGQASDIHLLPYNARTVPHVRGKVVYLSGDALESTNDQSMPYYYLAHIRAEDNALDALPDVDLAPGMPVDAYIQTKSKTFFDMMLKPFKDAVSKGLRQEG